MKHQTTEMGSTAAAAAAAVPPGTSEALMRQQPLKEGGTKAHLEGPRWGSIAEAVASVEGHKAQVDARERTMPELRQGAHGGQLGSLWAAAWVGLQGMTPPSRGPLRLGF